MIFHNENKQIKKGFVQFTRAHCTKEVNKVKMF